MWYGQALEAHVLSLCIASGEQDGEGAPKLGLVSKSRFNMLFFYGCLLFACLRTGQSSILHTL